MPSIINSAIARALQVPVSHRDPVRLSGLGGSTETTRECILHLRVQGWSKRRDEDLVEGHYTIRCLVVDDLPIHLLIGTHTMDHLASICERPLRKTTFGSIHRRVHMEVPFTS